MVGMLRPRYLARAIAEDALSAGKMAFVSGPRQVGKTTLGKGLLADPKRNYFSWDDTDFRRAWVTSPTRAVMERGEGPVLLDEIHKDRRWKSRLKGLYDTRGDELRIIVTGSARLDLYRRGGESCWVATSPTVSTPSRWASRRSRPHRTRSSRPPILDTHGPIS
jgi:predicted AAA+ superfamily ATPase